MGQRIEIKNEFYLEHENEVAKLRETDLVHLQQMTPLGRKVFCRNKGREILKTDPANISAKLLFSWFKLPAIQRDFELFQPNK